MYALVVSPVLAPALIGNVVGAMYIKDFLTQQGEARLIAFIEQNPWIPRFKRRRMWFGWTYDVSSREVPRYLGPLPPILQELAREVVCAGLMSDLPDQAIAQEYLPGQGIASHVDSHVFGPEVVSVSLGARCVMRFRHQERGFLRDRILDPRSALALAGPARDEWRHEIPGRRTDPRTREPQGRRLSITFRTLRSLRSAE